MAYEIGDKVSTLNGLEAVVTDKMYSEKKGIHYYGIQFKGHEEEEDDLFSEDELQPVSDDPVEYKVKVDVAENILVCTIYQVKNGEMKPISRGHGHIMHDGAVGVGQAASYAAKRAFMKINNDSITIEKE